MSITLALIIVIMLVAVLAGWTLMLIADELWNEGPMTFPCCDHCFILGESDHPVDDHTVPCNEIWFDEHNNPTVCQIKSDRI